jgi:hypothetical protein
MRLYLQYLGFWYALCSLLSRSGTRRKLIPV